jgi:potassium efflux system protein
MDVRAARGGRSDPRRHLAVAVRRCQAHPAAIDTAPPIGHQKGVEDLQALLFQAAAALAAAAFLEWLLRRTQRRLPLLLTRRFLTGPTASHPDPTLERLVGLAVLPLEVALWLGVVWFVSERVPLLHDVRAKVVGALDMGFTMPLFSMGERGYSLLDMLALPVVLAVLWAAVSAFTRLIESRVLRRGGMHHGGQETIGMLIRYALTLLGSLVVLQAWGIDVRTLAIAGSVLGVGIGFGLQNLANNFVSGLVISLERPIKPGDFVRVGEFQGTVERIGARSTEILTNDRVSVLVPNSKLLEQEVVSWTHNDPTCRITTRVGVAYGTSVALVRRALLEAARSHPLVIPDRAPSVSLASFGAHGMNFELDVWTREPRRQGEIISDLNFLIEAGFRRQGIEIPFPQHDLRLRSPELGELVAALSKRHFSAEELAAARAAIAVSASTDTTEEIAYPEDPGERCWTDAALSALVERMRGPEGVARHDRRYRLKRYPCCFLGHEAVDWLVRREGLTRDQAVSLGKQLVERNLLHHVLDEHTFHDSGLFYRFRADD